MKLCKGFRRNGDKCTNQTASPTGFCSKCRPSYDSVAINQMLHCVECPLTEAQCPVRNRAETDSPKGPVCWYELYDEIPRFKNRDQVVEAMKRIVGSNYRVALRLDRFIAAMGEYDSRLVNDFNRVSSTTFGQLMDYLRVRGWAEKDLPKDKAKRLSVMEAIFTKGKGSEGEAESVESVEAVVITPPDYDSDEMEDVERQVNNEDEEEDAEIEYPEDEEE